MGEETGNVFLVCLAHEARRAGHIRPPTVRYAVKLGLQDLELERQIEIHRASEQVSAALAKGGLP